MKKRTDGILNRTAFLVWSVTETRGAPAKAQPTPKTILGMTKVAKSLEVILQKFTATFKTALRWRGIEIMIAVLKAMSGYSWIVE